MELLGLVSVAGFALGWQHWRSTSAASAILHSVSAMLVVLFVSALLNVQMAVAIALLAAGSALAVLAVVTLIRSRKAPPVPVGMLVLLGTVYWTIHSGSALLYYDEYSHWGVFLKEMLASHSLWGADTNSMHPRYLPGTSLWQYYFALFSGKPEGAAYLAQFVLLLAPLMVLWEKISWRQYVWHAGVLLLLIVMLFNFGHGFTSLYVDHILGAWFAGVILNFLVDPRKSRVDQLACYLLPLAVLVLVKTTGVFFAMAAAGIIAMLLLAARNDDGTFRAGSWRWRRALAFPLAALVLCVGILSVWNANRDSLDVGPGGGEASSIIGKIATLESELSSAQQIELARRYKKVLLHQQISKDETSAQYNAFSFPLMDAFKDRFRLTTVSLLALALIGILVQWRGVVAREIRQSWLIAAVSVWLVAVVYIAGLYLGYLYMSAADYGLLLSSYVRYALSMLLPVALLAVVPLLPVIAAESKPCLKLGEKISIEGRSIFFFAFLALMFVFETPYLKPLYTQQPPNPFRADTQALTDRIRKATGPASLWVFFPNGVANGALGQMLQYQLSPGRVHVEETADALLADPLALQEQLRNYQYIWFAQQDAQFRRALEVVVGQELVSALFRVDTSGDKIAFVPVEVAP